MKVVFLRDFGAVKRGGIWFRRGLVATTCLSTVLGVGHASAQQAGTQASDGTGVLEPITVSGKTGSDTSREDDKMVAAKRSSGATKTDTPLIETPRSVSVVTRKEIEERGAQDIIEAVRYSAGVSTGAYGFDPRFDQIYIRGYDATTLGDYKDGLRQPYINYGTFRTDPYSLERVEVIKGPVSVLYGAGTPAGIVNKVPKLPTEDRIREVELLYGTKDRAQAAFDFGGPVTEGSDDFLYRIVGLARNGDTNFDIADDRYLLQPSFTWNPDAATSFTVYGLVQADETDSNPGVITDPSGKVHALRESDPDYDYQKIRQQQVGYKFEHDFGDGITVRQNVRYSHLDLRSRYLAVSGWTGTVAHRYATAIRDEMNVFQADNQVEAKFDTGALAHTLLLGLDYTNLTSSFGYGFDAADPAYDFDIANPTYGVSGPTPATTFSASDADLRQTGIYALDQVELDRWRFTLGGRQTWVEQTRDYVGGGSEAVNKNAFSMQAGALYLFDNGIAPFASYATSFEPISNRSADGGGILQPTKGEQVELGIKYQPPGSDILLSAVAYHLVEKNKPVVVDPNAGTYRSLGEVTSNGFELEARAAVMDGLDVIVAYNYNHAEITGAAAGSTEFGKVPAVTPEHVASLWANYKFDEGSAAPGLSVGAGVRLQSATYTDTSNTARNDAAVYLDASASYDFGAIDKKYEGVSAAFAVRNIADDRATVCNSGYCYMGQGRNVTASLKRRW
ncbi:TonB-dependent siderophore receptor [Mesorhizobium sp. BH1-1-4]|uniref:TonB-dependent siderophore receptor n=1 Tax=Mesorhizobium sp. BH1-1-4 TaxID=2876662 RepID=UPI001CD17BA5|nr:TonB-dependent siderophore receptor [Mesorhizobium sp. BH1-1-4]MBZ9996364.1 TonB-dependent siderophore receptor [Mesorhizobium sp. BH1-1-4]